MSLVRGLSLPHLVALLINGIIGAGILGLPARAYALAGPYSPLVWVASGILVAGIALCFAEVSSRYRDSGGPYLYALEAFGPTAGFLTGWLTLTSRVVAIATVASLLMSYVGALTGGTVGSALRIGIFAVLYGAMATVLVRGIRPTAWASSLLTLTKLGLIVGFVAIGLLTAPLPAIAGPLPTVTDVSAAVVILLFAFFGFENGTYAAGETVSPQRNMPIAILASVSMAALLYLGVQVVCIAAVPDLAVSDRPVADAVERLFGARAAWIVAIAAIVLMVGTMLAVLVGSTRLLLAMAERGQIPARFARLHPDFRTPMLAIGVMVTAAFVASLFAEFATAAAITVTARVLTYIVVCLSLPVLRRGSAPAALFRLRGGVAIALASAAVSTWLITTTSPAELLMTAAVAAAGWTAWVLRSQPSSLSRPGTSPLA
ncbi:MAG: amino acid permease [Acidimicrobiia bacterium]|nr:amino acid permease [Acidimicrobiia bacterium]